MSSVVIADLDLENFHRDVFWQSTSIVGLSLMDSSEVIKWCLLGLKSSALDFDTRKHDMRVMELFHISVERLETIN